MEAQSRQNYSSGIDYSGTNGPSRKERDSVTTGLGWFSIGLGLAEVFLPGRTAKLIGVEPSGKTKTVLRMYGMREMAAGIGILSQPVPASWMWSRVAGDLMDLASLTSALGSDDTSKGKLTFSTAAVLGVTALDVICAQKLSNMPQARNDGQSESTIKRSVIIGKSPEEVYNYWRNLENLPTFMRHLKSVRMTGDRRSHWIARIPGGERTIEWDAETVEDIPNRLISWRSVEGSDIHNAGSVRFERATGNRGTILHVEIQVAPQSTILAKVGKLFGSPLSDQLATDLYALRQVLETGEVVHSEPSVQHGMHPGQPPAGTAPEAQREPALANY